MVADKNSKLDRQECPHCGLQFRQEEAKQTAVDVFRCPFCDWEVQVG